MIDIWISPHTLSTAFFYIMVTTDLYGKPFQLKFVRPGQMLLFANILCDPPLGQTTVIPIHQHAVRSSHLSSAKNVERKRRWSSCRLDSQSSLNQAHPFLSKVGRSFSGTMLIETESGVIYLCQYLSLQIAPYVWWNMDNYRPILTRITSWPSTGKSKRRCIAGTFQ